MRRRANNATDQRGAAGESLQRITLNVLLISTASTQHCVYHLTDHH
jgi:hypothetical protein